MKICTKIDAINDFWKYYIHLYDTIDEIDFIPLKFYFQVITRDILIIKAL